ncbi:MAG: hypothetical protein M3252_03795 [Actinomycetota bacterium]|nr:hypothetical protein [Actinomycetota bacterium]
MADRPNQPPRDPEFLPEEPGAPRESREPGGPGEVVPGETREPSFGEPGLGAPGGDRLQPQPPGGEPGISPGPMPGERPVPGMGTEEPVPGGQRGGLGGEAGAPAAGMPRTGEPIEPKSTGEGVMDSVKDAFRKVKDAVTPDDKTRDEEERRGHLPQDPQEGSGGGLR